MAQDFYVQQEEGRGFVEKVPIESVVTGRFNPTGRTDRSNLAELIRSMKADGFWPHKPIEVGLDGLVGNGHRRLEAAKLAGLSHVYILRSSTSTGAEIFARDLVGKRTPTGREIRDALDKGIPIESCSDDIKYSRRKMIEVAGETALVICKEFDRPYTSWSIVLRIKKYLAAGGFDQALTPEFGACILIWISSTNGDQRSRNWMMSRGNPTALYNAIINQHRCPIVGEDPL